jgi:hypothetical protein
VCWNSGLKSASSQCENKGYAGPASVSLEQMQLAFFNLKHTTSINHQGIELGTHFNEREHNTRELEFYPLVTKLQW